MEAFRPGEQTAMCSQQQARARWQGSGDGRLGISIGTKQLKNASITTSKLKNGSVTGPKVARHSLTGAQISASTLGTVPNANHANSANTATSANTANTANAANSASSATMANNAQPVAFAHVSDAGVLDTADSKNVGSVTRVAGFVYCFSGIPFTPRGGQATVDPNNSSFQTAEFGLGKAPLCPAGTKAIVVTENPGSGGGGSAAGFFVVFYG